VTTETWVSVDIEASGPSPSTGSMLAIGACLVHEPDTGIRLFLRPDPALPWTAEAESIHGLRRDDLERDGLAPDEALRALDAWLGEVVPAASRPIFVALNAPFDWMFVADAAWRYLGRNPFGASALDLKALYLGRHLDDLTRWSETSRVSMLERYPVDLHHTHDPLDDAREQAAICRALLDGRPAGRPA